MKDEEICSFETALNFYKTTRCKIPEYSNIRIVIYF
jgi:hypothetical protein